MPAIVWGRGDSAFCLPIGIESAGNRLSGKRSNPDGLLSSYLGTLR